MIGVMRRQKALQVGRREPSGTPTTDLWGNEIESCGAELAVAKTVNQCWRMEIITDLRDKPADVGEDIEVRWTRHPNGHLYVYERDVAGRWYFLVTGQLPTFKIVGCIDGIEAMQERHWGQTPRGTYAFIIDQGDLAAAYAR